MFCCFDVSIFKCPKITDNPSTLATFKFFRKSLNIRENPWQSINISGDPQKSRKWGQTNRQTDFLFCLFAAKTEHIWFLGGSQNDEEYRETCTTMHRSRGRPNHRTRRPSHHRRHCRGYPNPWIRSLGRQRTLVKAAGQHREILPSSRFRPGQRGPTDPTSKELGPPYSASKKLPDLKHLGPCQSLSCRCRYWHR